MAGTNVGTAYVQIVPSAQGISGAISAALGNEATTAGTSAGTSFSGAMGAGIKSAGVAIAAATTAAVAAATGAAVNLGKEAFSNYAQFEQLAGGVEKLYGAASGKIQEFASEAYKTSGMSMNTYMETATSFSASLISSLGGDVDKAADLTDVAMRAMSDNVNVFGSDFQSVQNAFQGFAKQNYTMLDNLNTMGALAA